METWESTQLFKYLERIAIALEKLAEDKPDTAPPGRMIGIRVTE